MRILEASFDDHADLKAGEIKGVEVGTGKGSINLITVKPEGRNELPAADWINGLHLGAEARLGE